MLGTLPQCTTGVKTLFRGHVAQLKSDMANGHAQLR